MHAREKEQVLQAIRQLGRRVTAADVATKTGLPLQITTSQLNVIASETGGVLQVATTGDIAYCFSPGFQNAYLATGIKRVLQDVGSKVFRVGYYILRISFGIMLIVSLVTIVVLAFLIMTTLQRASSNDDGGGGGFEFDFLDFMIVRDLLWWGTWSALPDRYSYDEPISRQRHRSNFLLDCFSFLFGDGDPNAHLDERRWRLIAQTIKRNKGVVTDEQLAPYTGVDPRRGYGVLPVLVRFDGRPEVTDTGNIVYVFPSLQVSAKEHTEMWSGQEADVTVSDRSNVNIFNAKVRPRSFLNEFPWQFSHVPADSIWLVGLLGAANFAGAWWVFFQLHSPLAGMILRPFIPLADLLVIYGTLFLGLPLLRWLYIRHVNGGIENRNEQRKQYAEQVKNPSQELYLKLNEAQDYKIKEQMISQDKVVYSSDKDALEQEFDHLSDRNNS